MTNRDGLKPLAELMKPDVRNKYFGRTNYDTGETRANTLEDHYADIDHYSLHDQVPEDIATQYDVTRNLYLYAWFEYRFFNVAEFQVLTVLELALRKRIGEENLKTYIKTRENDNLERTGKKAGLRSGLKTMIEYCRDHGWAKNEGFSAWYRHSSQRALQQASIAAIRKMEETGVERISIDTSEFENLPPDPNYDHIQHLIDYTNKIRNAYAHGTTMLHSNVLYSFELVSEFINQIYSETSNEIVKE